MEIEDQLRERLRKVEALHFGATSAGEREAAGAAAERLRARLDEASRLDTPVEMKFRAGSWFSDSTRDSRIGRGMRFFHRISDGGGAWREPTAWICVIV
jgi:hypothetical protein